MVLRAEHSHLVKFEHLVSLSKSAILNNKAIPPVGVRLGSFHWELVSSLNLYYYLVVLLLFLDDLYAKISKAVEVRVYLHLTILSMALVHFGVIPTHRLIKLS